MIKKKKKNGGGNRVLSNGLVVVIAKNLDGTKSKIWYKLRPEVDAGPGMLMKKIHYTSAGEKIKKMTFDKKTGKVDKEIMYQENFIPGTKKCIVTPKKDGKSIVGNGVVNLVKKKGKKGNGGKVLANGLMVSIVTNSDCSKTKLWYKVPEPKVYKTPGILLKKITYFSNG